MRARRVIVAAVAVWLVLTATQRARAAVRVEADEVIFTLTARDAKEAFLVGDFNQWNPTVEPMQREGDQFVVRLFLVAGTYRYKFVVDGKAIADPDNRGPSPDQGSPIVLVERSGGLILSTEIPEEAARARSASYQARYLGFLRDDDGDTDVEQRVDLGLRADLDRLRARAIVTTADSSWTWSPPSIEVEFDRGFVEVEMGKLSVRGFENDSTWASSGPLGLVGQAGLYRYDAGFAYHGATAVAAAKHAALRARWSDETTRGDLSRASVPPLDLSSFANGTAAATTAYAYTPTFNGSDNVAVEASADAGDVASGYAFRNDTGVNPGLWVDVARAGVDFATQTYATKEDRHVSAAWLSWSGLDRTTLSFAYGWGDAEARAYATASGTSDLSAPLDAAAATTPVDVTRGILTSNRFVVEATSARSVATSLRWDYASFDFGGVEGTSQADVHRARADVAGTLRGWSLSGRVAYTHQRYRDTPDALYIDWPERNLWLSRWDALDAPSMVAIDLEQHTVWSLKATREGTRVDAGGEALLQTLEVVDAPVHAEVRAYGDVTVRGPWYLYGDARVSWYDRAAWGVDEAFWDFYVEGGYRKGVVKLSAGFGLDPWAFDPVISDFADLGRSEFLRDAIAGGVRRSDATAIGRALVERERALSDLRLFKLECVIELR
ncbi:MAG TPA: glycogen-binding domain-containing protein [Candidatus Krumholzibacteria bacterium]|nr:glycogen-binding domain-containing protein [Candidatus Krumholzibacteria bacterium]